MKRSTKAAASADAVEPVTSLAMGEVAWRIVGQGRSFAVAGGVIGDFLAITPSAGAATLGGVIARLLNTWLVAFTDVIVDAPPPTETEVVTPAPQNPVDAAKSRWRARALQESHLFERIMAAGPDADGVPAPPALDDDDA